MNSGGTEDRGRMSRRATEAVVNCAKLEERDKAIISVRGEGGAAGSAGSLRGRGYFRLESAGSSFLHADRSRTKMQQCVSDCRAFVVHRRVSSGAETRWFRRLNCIPVNPLASSPAGAIYSLDIPSLPLRGCKVFCVLRCPDWSGGWSYLRNA